MDAILALALKDLRVFLRDRYALFWAMVFPLVFALFFGAIFGGDGEDRAETTIAVVDLARNPDSAELRRRLDEHGSLRLLRPAPADEEAARRAVARRRALAFLVVPAGFELSPFRLFGPAEEGPRLRLGVDPSRSAEAGMLQGALVEVLFGALSERLGDPAPMRSEVERMRKRVLEAPDMPGPSRTALARMFAALGEFYDSLADPSSGGRSGAAFSPARLIEVVPLETADRRGPRSAFQITIPSACLWGLMSVALGFAMLTVRERSQGTLLRLRVAPISEVTLLAGKAGACFAACLGVMAFLWAFARLLLGVHADAPGLLGLAMAATAACFTGIMMAVSTLGRTEQAVAGAGWGIMMPFAMLGGGMIPLIAMPQWLADLSDLSPFKWGIYAIEGAVWRGLDLADLLEPCAILIAVGAASFWIGVVRWRRQRA